MVIFLANSNSLEYLLCERSRAKVEAIMRTFAEKPKATQGTTVAKSTIPGRADAQRSHQIDSIPHLLEISTSGDIYEQEADRVSKEVIRMPEPNLQHKCACGGTCTDCQKKRAGQRPEWLQMKHVGESDLGRTEAPPIVHEVLRSNGQPLDASTRAFMEPRFGHDFSRVRVHSDGAAEQSAQDVRAHAYTVGNDIVFGRGHFGSDTTKGRRLLAHELTHVIQQSAGDAPRAVARKPADAEKDKPKVKAKAKGCLTGCAQRWGQDTTCSKWGFSQGVAEFGEGKKWRSVSCCNSWPWSLEAYARNQLGLSGAASCPVQHQKEIATLSFGEKEIEVLCSDTISKAKVGQTNDPKDCAGEITTEVIEMSQKAMQELSGQVANALHIGVCFSGSKQDLCPHDGPGKAFFPEVEHCLTRGCTRQEGTPKLAETGWRRV
jgi:hypothetical protein